MHACPIKIKVVFFAIPIFSSLNLFSLDTAQYHSARYGAAGRGNNFDARSVDSNSAIVAVPVATGRRLDSPDTAEPVITGSGSTDSREAIFERGGAESKGLCARLCAYLCCQRQ